MLLQRWFLWKVHLTKISRLTPLRSLYLWSSVQITAIRLYSCGLSLIKMKRSAFIIWPCALKEEDNRVQTFHITGLMLQWTIGCAPSGFNLFLANMRKYSMCSMGLSFYTNVLPQIPNWPMYMLLTEGRCQMTTHCNASVPMEQEHFYSKSKRQRKHNDWLRVSHCNHCVLCITIGCIRRLHWR